MKILYALIVSITISILPPLYAQSATSPKREFRAVWVATVTNIDWPSSKTLSTTSQKNEVIAILDKHKANNINAILLQVRPSCDAFYQNGYEPLSEWLVGVQGGNLSIYYDPLQFWIDEAHKRGMELHAWINPYRSVHSSSSSVHSTHISKTHPEWNINYGGSPYKFLDPGLPEVREYVVKVVMDIVRRYNIDGIHYDDYFYPYGGMSNQDSVSWGLYGSGWASRGDWRRNNVNVFVAMLHDSIKAVKPWVKYGISPFGIWRPNNPPGITGLDAYNVIYCDALNWIANKKIDYLTPQLYWQFGGGQDYAKLMPWWSQQVSSVGRHLYTGNAVYRIAAGSGDWSPTEIQRQIDSNRVGGRALGFVAFSSKSVTNNLKGIQDSLRNNQFKYKALPPAMPWLDNVPPLPPVNFIASVAGNIVTLNWQKGATASDGDTNKYFVLYRAVNEVEELNIENPKYIRYVSMDGSQSFSDTIPSLNSVQYQAVITSHDKLWNESSAGARVFVAPSGKPYFSLKKSFIDLGEAAIGTTVFDTVYLYNRASPLLNITSTTTGTPVFSASPQANAIADSTALIISYTPSNYDVTSDTIFITNNSALNTVKIAVRGNSPRPTMKMVNSSIVFGNVRVGDTLWKSLGVTNQSLNALKIDSLALVPSSKGVFRIGTHSFPLTIAQNDTVLLTIGFLPDTTTLFFDTLMVYSNATNSPTKAVLFGIGQDPMSVEPVTGLPPTAYHLEQNFPNPFNPTTTLSFTLPKAGYTVLKIYDVLGREVATVVDEMLDAGTHRYQFNGSNLSSGVYLYRLVSGTYVETRKMVLQK
ncbi:MAG: family 10 glycosylhydrolase [Bacteroidota bacterium]